MKIDNVHSEEQFSVAYGDRTAQWYADLLATVVSCSRPGRVLDVGAGLGFLVELGHAWGVDIVGIEGSCYAVEHAQSRVPGLKMIQQDVGERFPFEDGSFSSVVLNQVVEHIDQSRLDNVLTECARVLGDGGLVFINSPSRRNRKERKEATHINLLLPSELEDCVVSHGFKVVSRPNFGLWFMPEAKGLVRGLARYLLRKLPHDWLSASANIVAVKSAGVW